MSEDDARPEVRLAAGGRQSATKAVRRRAETIRLTMQGTAVAEIATALNVSERHIRRILCEPAVREQIQRLDDEVLRSVARRSTTFGPSAVTVLATVMASKSEPASARVSAAAKVLDVMVKVAELADLAVRLERLEQRLGGTAPWRAV